jgi:hypothetical protein
MMSIAAFLLATAATTAATGEQPVAAGQGVQISAVASVQIIRGHRIGHQPTGSSVPVAMQITSTPSGQIIEFQ